MIRINLLGRARPKAQRQAVPLEATLQLLFLVLALALGIGFLGIDYWQLSNKIKDVQKDIDQKKQRKGATRPAQATGRRVREAKEFAARADQCD